MAVEIVGGTVQLSRLMSTLYRFKCVLYTTSVFFWNVNSVLRGRAETVPPCTRIFAGVYQAGQVPGAGVVPLPPRPLEHTVYYNPCTG